MSSFANKVMYSSTLVAFAVLQGCEEVPVNDNQNDQVASSSDIAHDLMVNLQGSEVIQKFESSVEAVIEAEVIQPLLEEVTPSLECKQTFTEKFFKLETHQTISSGATGTTRVKGFNVGLLDSFMPIGKTKDYLYRGQAIECTIGATQEETTCTGSPIEDEASRTAITTCVQRTEMQHSKHLKITVAVVGLVVVAIIVAGVLAVQHKRPDGPYCLPALNATPADFCESYESEDDCKAQPSCVFDDQKSCTPAQGVILVNICKELSVDDCDMSSACNSTCASFGADECAEGLMDDPQEVRCNTETGCNQNTCCKVAAVSVA
jgi:hypothetical protein